MDKPGPSPEYRELLEGRIEPEEYLRRIKEQATERLERSRPDTSRDAAPVPARRATAG